MSKSNYPNKLDTSAEIQHVRDNITEIGSDVVNSIRSAIFQIEKTLGTNPQGAIGNTVSNRINRTLDDRGNIKKEALDRANVLSGPIIDADVSKVAAIHESKLKLDFPTQLLQDEVSILNRQIQSIIDKVDELNYILSTHVNPEATNRHKAKAITVEENLGTASSSTATTSFSEKDLQSFINELYSSHINYNGDSISSVNRSHEANQIFFDNINVPDIIKRESVQGAIEDLADLEGVALRDNTLNLNSNGIIRSGSTLDSYENIGFGSQIVSSSDVNYEAITGKSTTRFFFTEEPTPTEPISEFDVLTISGSTNDENNISYLIKGFGLDTGTLSYVDVYGSPVSESEDGLFGTITKNIYTSYNANGLNCTVRYRRNKTNIPDVQVANPNSATIITRGLNAEAITSGQNSFNISIDGKESIEIEAYDSNYKNQSLDTIVSKINKFSIENHLNIMAYKIQMSRCYELVISHNMPNDSSDIVNRTLKITPGDSLDGTSHLGMTYVLEKEVEGRSGNTYHINGLLISSFGQIKTYGSSEVQIASDLTINSISGVDFRSSKIRTGDLAIITNSTDSSDDGTYRILEVNSSIITLDYDTGSFSGELDESSIVHIVRCCASVGEMNFEELGPILLGPTPTVGSVLFDVFIDENNDVMFRRRLEQSGILADSGIKAIIVDVSKNFITSDEVATISINSSGIAELSGPGFTSSGPPVPVNSSGLYKIFASDRMSYIILQVECPTGISPSSTISTDIYGYDELTHNGLVLCRGAFSTAIGRVISSSTLSSENKNGVPVLFDKRTTGTVDHTIISETFLEKYIQGPRNELRGSGIVRGCNVSSVTIDSDIDGNIAKFTVSAGVAIINGIRYEFEGVEDYIQRSASGTFYVALDSNGCIITAFEISSSGESPFAYMEVAHLARVKLDTSTSPTTVVTVYDLRLFVDNIDYKIIADITVSNDSRFSHFTDVNSAVRYAMMFGKIFPTFGATPSVLIKEGSYEVSEPIIINRDITISGVGPATVIKRSSSFRTLCQISTSDSYIPNSYKSLFMIGMSDDPELGTYRTGDSSQIKNGVTFRNFTYKTGGTVNGVGSVFSISHKEDDFEQFIFENISFLGPTNAQNNTTGSKCDFEWMITLARMPGSSSTSSTLTDDDVVNSDGTRRKFRGVSVNNCKFKRMGCGASIICAGGVLKYSTISNNIVTDLPVITGDLEVPTAKAEWSATERGGIHNFMTDKYPRDWFFSFVSSGHGWRDNSEGAEYLLASGIGCNERGNTIVIGDAVENVTADATFDGTVICSELFRQGIMSREIFNADRLFGSIMEANNKEALHGYRILASPIVSLMKKSRVFTTVISWIAMPWAHQMAYEVGAIEKGSLFGKAIMKIGIPISKAVYKLSLLGKKLNKKISPSYSP